MTLSLSSRKRRRRRRSRFWRPGLVVGRFGARDLLGILWLRITLAHALELRRESRTEEQHDRRQKGPQQQGDNARQRAVGLAERVAGAEERPKAGSHYHPQRDRDP